MAYPNGRVPLDRLVQHGEHYFFPGTLARWVGFQRDVHAEAGVWLYITPGPNAYRSYDDQGRMRAELGIGAAYPGNSSHGGLWTGQTKGHSGLPTWVQNRESGAIDVGNWFSVPWEVFSRLARKWGFIPDIVVPTELWHLVDLNPWQVPEGATDSKEEDMLTPDQAKLLRQAKNASMHALDEVQTTKVATGRIELLANETQDLAEDAKNAAMTALAEARTTKVAVGRMETILSRLAEKLDIDVSDKPAEPDAQ